MTTERELVINVKDYGATGNGLTDDTAVIQAAISIAAVMGANGTGGLGQVFIPPGTYRITAPLTNDVADSYVAITGAVAHATTLMGNFAGYIIDQNTNAGVIRRIESLRVINSFISTGCDVTVGCIRYNNAWNGLIQNVKFAGWTGIAAYSATFETALINVSSDGSSLGNAFWGNGSAGGPIAFYLNGCGAYNCYALGYYAGFVCFGSDVALMRCRSEANNFGFVTGASVSGSTLTNDNMTSFSMTAFSTERCMTGLYLNACGAASISGGLIQGAVGLANFNISNITWSAGVATVTLSGGNNLTSWGWTGGSRQINIEGVISSGYNTGAGVYVTGTYISPTSFSYIIASNPGLFVNNGQGDWSLPIDFGMRVRAATQTVISGVVVGVNTINTMNFGAGIDLTPSVFMTSPNNSGVVMNACTAGPCHWAMPGPAQKACFRYLNCDQPSSKMNFADLPGQPGVYNTVAVEGMEFDVSDDNSAGTFGAISLGGGTRHAKVRYNGTNWTVMGI